MEYQVMASHPSQKNEAQLYEIRNHLKEFQAEWSETLDNLANAKADLKGGDLFATIDYLIFCDQFYKAIYLDFKAIDSLFQSLNRLREKFQDKPHLEFIEEISDEIQDFKNNMQKKIQAIDEDYSVLAETTLQHSQDLIGQFAESIEQEKDISLQAEINQNLDKELFLQELKDSLEAYRQAREDFISEIEMDNIRKMPGDEIPEDLGEENPEVDSILSQLDSAITACDIALLNKEIGD